MLDGRVGVDRVLAGREKGGLGGYAASHDAAIAARVSAVDV